MLLSGAAASGKELLVHGGGKVNVFGTITPHGMRCNSDAPATAVSNACEVRRSPPAKASGEGPLAAWDFQEGQGDNRADSRGRYHGHLQVQWAKDACARQRAWLLAATRPRVLMIDTKGMPRLAP